MFFLNALILDEEEKKGHTLPLFFFLRKISSLEMTRLQMQGFEE